MFSKLHSRNNISNTFPNTFDMWPLKSNLLSICCHCWVCLINLNFALCIKTNETSQWFSSNKLIHFQPCKQHGSMNGTVRIPVGQLVQQISKNLLLDGFKYFYRDSQPSEDESWQSWTSSNIFFSDINICGFKWNVDVTVNNLALQLFIQRADQIWIINLSLSLFYNQIHAKVTLPSAKPVDFVFCLFK